jgi:hypothetical protein
MAKLQQSCSLLPLQRLLQPTQELAPRLLLRPLHRRPRRQAPPRPRRRGARLGRADRPRQPRPPGVAARSGRGGGAVERGKGCGWGCEAAGGCGDAVE